jgi:cytidylate kinase
LDKAIIAIDGFASTGKSTLAKMLSKFIDLPYIDSGALFRGITFLALEKGWIVNSIIDEISIEEGIQEVKISFDSLI